MRYSTIAIAICGLVWTVQARADDWFVGVHTGVGIANFDNIDDSGTIGTGEMIGDDIDGDVPSDEEDEGVAYVGISVGRTFGAWAIETDLSWRYRADWDVSIPTPSIGSITNVQTDVETTSLLLNLTRSQPLRGRWSWQMGGGIGVAFQDLSSKYVERAVPGVRPREAFRDHEDSAEFAWNLMLGVAGDLSERWRFHATYRYVDLGEVAVGPYRERDAELEADHRAHELTFSLTRRFQLR